jgi:ATP-dependent Lon protease
MTDFSTDMPGAAPAPGRLSELNEKINQHFPGLVVRKDLTKRVRGNSVVPTYVLEYLLGQYCATDDEDTILSGIETVKRILAEHFVHRSEARLVQSKIREKGEHRVIDKVSVELNASKNCYEAEFVNLGLKKIEIDSEVIRRHPKLLVGGVWSISDLGYQPAENSLHTPWTLQSLKPIQVSNFDLQQFLDSRGQFTTEEWLDTLIQSIGLNPEQLSRRGKLLQLLRLVPYCERNYNLIELGPKGTGKSHVFSEFSPHGILISGGEVTVAKLFVNNSSGKVGLVGYWDSVAFDEFAGKDKRVDKNLVDIMKNYMANKSFSRGVDSVGAEASMSFLGNTKRNVAYMMRHSHFFEELPDKYIDSAFLDRLHCYIPGWESSPIRADLFTEGYGFIVDYLAEGLKHFRNLDFSHLYQEHFELSSDITTRDRDGVQKTFSGLIKILYPHQQFTLEETREALELAMECRRRVKSQIMKIDETFPAVDFSYLEKETELSVEVRTLEEKQFPKLAVGGTLPGISSEPFPSPPVAEPSEEPELISGEHKVYEENFKGVSYQGLLERHLQGARHIVLEDPYIRKGYQFRNLMEFLSFCYQLIPADETGSVHLRTVHSDDVYDREQQLQNLDEVVKNFEFTKLPFTYEVVSSNELHARCVQADTGWKITMDRGLDIFQPFETGHYSLPSRIQEERMCRKFEITYLKIDPTSF